MRKLIVAANLSHIFQTTFSVIKLLFESLSDFCAYFLTESKLLAEKGGDVTYPLTSKLSTK